MDLQEIRDLDFNDLGSASTGAKAFRLATRRHRQPGQMIPK